MVRTDRKGEHIPVAVTELNDERSGTSGAPRDVLSDGSRPNRGVGAGQTSEGEYARASAACQTPLTEQVRTQPHLLKPSRSLLWAALLHDIAKPETFTIDEEGRGHFFSHPERGAVLARQIMNRLSLPSRLISDVALLVHYHDMPLKPCRSSILDMLGRLTKKSSDAPRLMGELLDLKVADARGKTAECADYVDEISKMRRLYERLLEQGSAYSVKTLALTGSDLISAGIAPGPQVGELLNRALELHIDGEVPNDAIALLKALQLGL
ncbi:HD domain-containing protein [Collinsella sp. AGMB00827]|uniref:HD domain-containing protein n=2 Tax=Collinsella ureilytica TaxID=2869515 RepID=A0ABS7MKE2_9ACTN|nr:HD domain-containing protein [Collinsella urealyticum]